jgi:hypothetical protein
MNRSASRNRFSNSRAGRIVAGNLPNAKSGAFEITKPNNLAQQVVVRLKERSLAMLKNDLILRNPLRMMEDNAAHRTLPDGGFGAVVARAGVGKTALLVQLALNSMLRNQKVLHISLNDPVNKVSLWYDEVFSHIARQYSVTQTGELWETLLPHRFIMTFRVEGFSVPRLQERLTDLTAQGIFQPQMIIIDGIPFDASTPNQLAELKTLAQTQKCHIWFTVRSHRHETPDDDGVPIQLADIENLFEVIIQLQPVGKEIRIIVLKGPQTSTDPTELRLDPSTMLITDKNPA